LNIPRSNPLAKGQKIAGQVFGPPGGKITIQQGKLLRQEAKEDPREQNKYIFNSLDTKYLILIYFVTVLSRDKVTGEAVQVP